MFYLTNFNTVLEIESNNYMKNTQRTFCTIIISQRDRRISFTELPCLGSLSYFLLDTCKAVVSHHWRVRAYLRRAMRPRRAAAACS